MSYIKKEKRNHAKTVNQLTKHAIETKCCIRGFDAKELVALPFYVCSVGRKELPADSYSISTEIHNNFVELCWSESGMGEIDFYGRKFKLEAGDVFYFLPGEAHVMRGLSERWKSRWLCFEGPLAVASFMAYGLERVSHAAAFPEELFAELERDIYVRDPGCIARLSGILVQILSELVIPPAQNSKNMFERCVDYIRANCSDPELSVKTLCDRFGIPETTLQLYFRRNRLTSPGHFIMQLRMQLANSFLRGSSLPIAEVARRCGFRSPSSFARFVRSRTKKSPQELRAGETEN